MRILLQLQSSGEGRTLPRPLRPCFRYSRLQVEVTRALHLYLFMKLQKP